jgi:hypothetical protein
VKTKDGRWAPHDQKSNQPSSEQPRRSRVSSAAPPQERLYPSTTMLGCLSSSSALTLCARVHPKRESSSDRSNPKSSSFQQFLLHWRPEKSEKMLHLTRIRENPFCPLMFIYELIRLKCSCKSSHRNPTPIKNMPQRLQLAKLFLPSNHTNQKHLINLQITSP